jgi:hypothetical protein
MTNTTRELSTVGTVGAFLNRRACSETLFCVLDRAFAHPAKPEARQLEERACSTLAGGIIGHGYQCGMLWGAALNAGAQVYRHCGNDTRAEAESIIAAQRLVKSFRARNASINCADLTMPDIETAGMTYFLLKGGLIRCLHRAANYAPAAFDEVAACLSKPPTDVPCSPASCSAMLAKKVGASDRHTVMAAGFAGGIGLSGGGCGALGTAVWIIAMNTIEEGVAGNLWESKLFRARANAAIDEFLKVSGHEIECAEIVGRRFQNLDDHARHLRDGGCAAIIETLAAQCATATSQTSH